MSFLQSFVLLLSILCLPDLLGHPTGWALSLPPHQKASVPNQGHQTTGVLSLRQLAGYGCLASDFRKAFFPGCHGAD